MKKIKAAKKEYVYTIFNQYTGEWVDVKVDSEKEAFILARNKLKPPLQTAFVRKNERLRTINQILMG